jgi:hypothetical protein
MVPYCLEGFQMQLFLVKIRMMEIHNDDVIMTVGAVTVIRRSWRSWRLWTFPLLQR